MVGLVREVLSEGLDVMQAVVRETSSHLVLVQAAGATAAAMRAGR
jgi:hypothetical protein